MAAALNDCLGGRADLVFDPAPGDSLRSPWRTYRRALEETPPSATHRLVLQDDVIVCDYFLTGAERAIRARPNRMLFFFVPGTPQQFVILMREACDAGQTWAEVELRGWAPVVATLWPVDLIAPCLAFDDARRAAGAWPPGFVADDEIVGRFIRETGQAWPLACVPSLVEHPDTVPSIMNGHRNVGDGLNSGRRAAIWIGDYPDCYACDARRIDFTVGAGG
jgi:hypothetical protein